MRTAKIASGAEMRANFGRNAIVELFDAQRSVCLFRKFLFVVAIWFYFPWVTYWQVAKAT